MIDMGIQEFKKLVPKKQDLGPMGVLLPFLFFSFGVK